MSPQSPRPRDSTDAADAHHRGLLPWAGWLGALALVAAIDLNFLGMAVIVFFGVVWLGSKGLDRIRRDGRPVPVRG